MPFEIIRNDLTKMKVDAIVNPTDPFFSGSGGVDLAVHQAAGPELEVRMPTIGWHSIPARQRLPAGITCRQNIIIHTVGPIWRGGNFDEERTAG